MRNGFNLFGGDAVPVDAGGDHNIFSQLGGQLFRNLFTRVSSLWPTKVKVGRGGAPFLGVLQARSWDRDSDGTDMGSGSPPDGNQDVLAHLLNKTRILNRPFEISTKNLFMESVPIVESQ